MPIAKRSFGCSFRNLYFYYIYGIFGYSLLIQSTVSMIQPPYFTQIIHLLHKLIHNMHVYMYTVMHACTWICTYLFTRHEHDSDVHCLVGQEYPGRGLYFKVSWRRLLFHLLPEVHWNVTGELLWRLVSDGRPLTPGTMSATTVKNTKSERYTRECWDFVKVGKSSKRS